ncbi:hypothetical protein D9599_25305 [Roseomonas sp. KE2513]|nr:hypothetical protein [Roseomonas sp. KE2513]
MAAALRTPSLKYRSFGNEPVRHVPAAAPPDEDQAFSILGDALAGAEELPPDAVLGERSLHRDVGYPSTYAELAGRADRSTALAPDAYRPVRREAQADGHLRPTTPAHESPVQRSPEPEARYQPARDDARDRPLPCAAGQKPVVAQAITRPGGVSAPLADAAMRPGMVPAAPLAPPLVSAPPVQSAAAGRHDAQGSSLLQTLLGTPSVAALPAPAAGAAPVAVAAPAKVAGETARALLGVPPAWPSFRYGSGTGSSLLDTLFGADSPTAGIHYPLLDALGAAMQGSPVDPSSRHWPAARVDVALPELLRRVAAGVRAARNAA